MAIPTASTVAARGHVLVVDDSPANLRYLTDLLREQGYAVHAAPRAELALRFLQANPPPDILLLDIQMPGMDGFALCERLKADAGMRDIPIIFISAADDVTHKVHAFGAGGVDYVVKPFQAEEVLARVSTHIALRTLQQHLEARVNERTVELQRAQRLLQAIIDHSAAIICVKDLQGRYVLANRRFHAMFVPGSDADATGLTDAQIFPADTAAALRDADAAVLASGSTTQREEVLPGVDGPRTYVSVRTLLDGLACGQAVCCIFTDITQRVHEEQALRALNELLESRLAQRVGLVRTAPAR
jgi:PAS domain S-box-containing protein